MSRLSPAELWVLDGLERGGHTVGETIWWAGICAELDEQQRGPVGDGSVVTVSPPGLRRRWWWRR